MLEVDEMNKDEIVKALTIQAHKKFPEFKGIKPQIKWTVKTENKSICTLIFQRTGSTAAGSTIYQRLKVTGDAQGKILKVSTSK
jgi:hypothetical protein